MKHLSLRAFIGIIIQLFIAGQGMCQSTTLQSIYSWDSLSYERFGYDVAISGDFAFASASYTDSSSSGINQKNIGEVFVLTHDTSNNWYIQQKLVDQDSCDCWFGYAVDVHGDYAVAGAMKNAFLDTTVTPDSVVLSGTVSIFKRTQGNIWKFHQKIMPDDGEWHQRFGASVTIYDSTIAVGAILTDWGVSPTDSVLDGGAVYIFEKDSTGYWYQTKKLVPNHRDRYDKFGYDIDLYKDRLIVGTPYTDTTYVYPSSPPTTETEVGTAYIFEKDNQGAWNLELITWSVAPYLNSTNFYGESVAISGNYAAIGGKGYDYDTSGARVANNMYNTGLVEIYHRNNGVWSMMKQLKAPHKFVDDQYYGTMIDLKGNHLLVSSLDTVIPNRNILYLYKITGNTVSLQDVIYSPDTFQGMFGKIDKIGNQLIFSNHEYTIYNNGNWNQPLVTRLGVVYLGYKSFATGIELAPYNESDEIKIYPNPTNSSVNIEWEGIESEVIMRLYNNTGQVVDSKTVFQNNQAVYHLDKLPSGLYFIECAFKNKTPVFLKVLKE